MTNIIIHTCQGEYLSLDRTEYIEHHGILGQKWGVRRFQNKDGSLTSVGQKRYLKNTKKSSDKAKTKKNEDTHMSKADDKALISLTNRLISDEVRLPMVDRAYKLYQNSDKSELIDKFNKDYESRGKKVDKNDWRYQTELDEYVETVGFANEYRKLLVSELEKSKEYKKAQSIVQKYGEQSLSTASKKCLNILNDLGPYF